MCSGTDGRLGRYASSMKSTRWLSKTSIQHKGHWIAEVRLGNLDIILQVGTIITVIENVVGSGKGEEESH